MGKTKKIQKKNKKRSHFKVGDKIIDFGQVYRIFKIEQRENEKGKVERILHFKPGFKSEKNDGLTCSIPEKNVDLTTIRRPVSKVKLSKIFKVLSRRPETRNPVNAIKAKEVLKLNAPFKTARILKNLWLDKQDSTTNFTISKRNLFDLSMRRLVEEVALVSGTSIKKAQEKIKAELEKISKK